MVGAPIIGGEANQLTSQWFLFLYEKYSSSRGNAPVKYEDTENPRKLLHVTTVIPSQLIH